MARKIKTSTHWTSDAPGILGGLAAGVASLAAFSAPAVYISAPYRKASDALRSDWLRIGADMQTVIDRKQNAIGHKNARVQKTAKSAA